MTDASMSKAAAAGRAMILPLALAQFIASYAATNMNVAISAIATDLGTDVAGVQTAITLFTLTMAALMIPGSKLTDIWGRKRCFILGLIVYAVGGLLALLSFGLPQLIIGYSLLEGIGSALMIPPIYILVTVAFPDIKSRAKYFGVVSGAGGLGAAAGPLIGGVVTSAISWRASFGLQVLVVAWIILLARKIADPGPSEPKPRFDLTGAVLSAAGLFFVVLGLLQSRTYGFGKSRQDFTIGSTVVIPKGSISPVWIYVAIGALFLLWFFLHTRSWENRGRDVLLPLRLFRNKTSNLGLGTQTIQWLILQGSFFVVSVYLQEVWKYDAIKTGLILTPGTIGILVASAAAGRFARRHPQRWLIIVGFLITAVGMILLLTLVRAHSGVWTWIPGLFLFGAGVGTMLTSSVNVVQSSFPEADQGEISGLSRSVSNLGSSMGTALVGSVLVAVKLPEGRPFAVALTIMLVFALIGLVLGVLIPRRSIEATTPESPGTEPAARQPTSLKPDPAGGCDALADCAWIAHNYMTRFVKATDRGLIRLNLLLLLFVSFLPFTTAIAATHLFPSFLPFADHAVTRTDLAAERAAVVIFGLNLTLAALMLYVMIRHAGRTLGLAADDTAQLELRGFARERKTAVLLQVSEPFREVDIHAPHAAPPEKP